MEKIACLTVVKPQGIKGELKAKILADDFSSVSKIKKLYDEKGNEYAVKLIKNAFNGFAFITLSSVLTRNDAELFRGVTFYAQKSAINKRKSDYFIVDIIGLKVMCDGEEFGVIKDVISANVDMFEVKLSSGKTAYFPFLNSLGLNFDFENKEVHVSKSKLDGVVFYED